MVAWMRYGRRHFYRPIAAVHESAFGTKRTSRCAQPMSAFGGKEDITKCAPMSAFDPKRTGESSRFDAGGFNDRPPFLNFGLLQSAKRLRCLLFGGRNCLALVNIALLYRRIG